jgi:hypothetical protein
MKTARKYISLILVAWVVVSAVSTAAAWPYIHSKTTLTPFQAYSQVLVFKHGI